jgi:hypothetical protein
MASHFQMNLSVPDDRRYAGMLRDLAVHGARQAGHSEAEAAAFGREVEQAARQSLAPAPTEATVPVTVRCDDGPVEVTIGSCCVSTTR